MIYIFRDEKLHQVLSNSLPGGLPLQTARLKEQINGEVSLSFSIPSDHPDSGRVQRWDWAIYKDLDGHFRAFIITEEKETHDRNGLFKSFITEELAITELNDEVVEDVRPQNTTALDALTRILKNTRWQPGIVDAFGKASTNVYYESAIDGIEKVLDTWGGELRFRVTIDDSNRITGRYVDILSRLGRDTGKRFEYGRDLDSVTRSVDMKPLKTALYGRGKGEETDSGGYGRRWTFEKVEWKVSNGDPVDKPLGQRWVGDPEALAIWGHKNADGTRRHRKGIVTFEEETDPARLLQLTWDHLQTLKDPFISYEMKAIDLERVSGNEYKHESVRLGDGVVAVDRHFSWDVQLRARVVDLDRDLLDPKNTDVVLGNILSELGDLIRGIEKKVENKISVGSPIGWLEGIIDAARTQFHATKGYVYFLDEEGILTTNKPKDNIDDPATEAVHIKGGKIALADSRLPDGSFDFRTFISGSQVIADFINAGKLRTDNVEIGDEDGRVLINKDGLKIKNGSLEVYSTPDGTDNGVMIRGNKIFTNFVKNPDFDLPLTSTDWTKNNSNVFHENGIIKISTYQGMPSSGVYQDIDIYHPRATFQALFRANGAFGSDYVYCRFHFRCYDSNGIQTGAITREEVLAYLATSHQMTVSLDFPAGTVRCRLFVEMHVQRASTKGLEIHWVKGSYDDYVVQEQLKAIPIDPQGIDSQPQIQQVFCNINIPALSAGQLYEHKAYFNTPVRSGPGRINVQVSPYGADSGYFQATCKGAAIDHAIILIRPHVALSARTVYANLLVYRVSYYANS